MLRRFVIRELEIGKKTTGTGQPYEAVNIFPEIYDGLAYN